MTSENSASLAPSALPGFPTPYVLPNGGGDKFILFDQIFTLLVNGEESGGDFDVFLNEGHAGQHIPPHLHQETHETFLVAEGAVRLWMDDEKGFRFDRVLAAGEFGFVPKNVVHSYRMETTSRIIGTSSGGFSGFFADAGRATDNPAIPTPDEFHIVKPERMAELWAKYSTVGRPDIDFDLG